MIQLICRQCHGTGTIPNENYELCRELKNCDSKKYFGIYERDYGETEDHAHSGCGCEKVITCPNCSGYGILTFADEEWEVKLVPEVGEGEE
ncbi:MAG: hypothetical protein LUQ40_05885 [Methanomicrobiales archaeon]|nr:hypothetical protein [Methanomicrobiales archaeon]